MNDKKPWIIRLLCLIFLFSVYTFHQRSGYISQSDIWDAVIVDTSSIAYIGTQRLNYNTNVLLNLRFRAIGSHEAPSIITLQGSSKDQISHHHALTGVMVLQAPSDWDVHEIPEMCHFWGTWKVTSGQAELNLTPYNESPMDRCHPININFILEISYFQFFIFLFVAVCLFRTAITPGKEPIHLFDFPRAYDLYVICITLSSTLGFLYGVERLSSSQSAPTWMSSTSADMVDLPFTLWALGVSLLIVPLSGIMHYPELPPSIRNVSSDDVVSVEGLTTFMQISLYCSILVSFLSFKLAEYFFCYSIHAFVCFLLFVNIYPLWRYSMDDHNIEPAFLQPVMCAFGLFLQTVSCTWLLWPGVAEHLGGRMMFGDALFTSYSNELYHKEGFSIVKILLSREFWPWIAKILLFLGVGYPAYFFWKVSANRPCFSFTIPDYHLMEISKRASQVVSGESSNREIEMTEVGESSSSTPNHPECASYEIECSICLCDIEYSTDHSLAGSLKVTPSTPRESFVTTPCNHVFHVLCLSKWTEHKMECPNCRGKFSSFIEGFHDMQALAAALERDATPATQETGNANPATNRNNPPQENGSQVDASNEPLEVHNIPSLVRSFISNFANRNDGREVR